MSGDDFVTINVGDLTITADLSLEPVQDRPAIIEDLTVSTQAYSAYTGVPSSVNLLPGSSTQLQRNPYSTADLGSPGLSFDGPAVDLNAIDRFMARQGQQTDFQYMQESRVANRDAAAAAATIAAENKRFNDAISAFDREVLLQNRKFEDEARRLSDIAAQTKSQYDIQAAQRAVATAERNKAEQAANFELQMDSFDNTQGDFFRDTSTAADPSRAMRSAYVGNQSPLAQYAQRVQDLATASNQEKLDIQQERITEADRQAQAAISDRQAAALAAEMEAAQKETNRQLAASVVSRSVGASRLSSDQRESLIQTKLDGGDWQALSSSFNTVSSDVGAPQGSVDVAAEKAVQQLRSQPNSVGNDYGWGGIPL